MHSRYLGVALAMIAYSLSAGNVHGQPQAAVGIVLSARSGQVGAGSAAPGTTVFSGDRILTQKDSGLILRAGEVQFSFQDETVATLYARPEGIALEIERGSITFFAQSAAPGFTLFVSDVRITPNVAQAFSGDIAVLNDCAAIVTARVGNLLVKRGAQAEEITSGNSRQIAPIQPIEQRPPGTAPGDNSFHKGHAHKGCTPAVAGAKGVGPNWFVPVLLVEAVAAPIVAWRLMVSPH